MYADPFATEDIHKVTFRPGDAEGEAHQATHPFLLPDTPSVGMFPGRPQGRGHLVKGFIQVLLREYAGHRIAFLVQPLKGDGRLTFRLDKRSCNAHFRQDRCELREPLMVIREGLLEKTLHLREDFSTGIETQSLCRVCVGNVFADGYAASLLGEGESVLRRHFPHEGRGAAFFVVIVDLPALLVSPHRNNMVVLTFNVKVTVHQIGLAAVSEVLHQGGDKREDLVLRAGVFIRRVHRSMETLFRHIIPGPLIAFEKVIDGLPVGGFHVREAD